MVILMRKDRLTNIEVVNRGHDLDRVVSHLAQRLPQVGNFILAVTHAMACGATKASCVQLVALVTTSPTWPPTPSQPQFWGHRC